MLNHILARLSEQDRAALLPKLEPVSLPARKQLDQPNARIEHVYFIETGLAAVVSVSGKHRIGLGVIGPEGASGIPVILGDVRWANSTVMLTRGEAFRIAADALRQSMGALPELQRLMLRYCLAFFAQAAHTTLSNTVGLIEQRVARWVLMTSDRFHGGEIPLTHDTIGYLLGVRRAGISVALEHLAREDLIQVGRGWIKVLDRPGVEKIAGGFYGLPEKEFVRLIETYWPPAAPPEKPK